MLDKVLKGCSAFCGTLFGGFLAFCRTFAWPLSFALGMGLVALVAAFYFAGHFTPKQTVEQARIETIQKLSEDERKLLATAIIRDAMLKSEPLRVQEGVGWANLNYRKTYGVGIANIVKKSLTMIPVNYVRQKFLAETQSWWVKTFEASDSQWTEALALADRLVAKGSAALSDQSLACATHYVRKKRETHEESPEAIAQLEAEMSEVPKGSGANPGQARFFCPKKK